MFDFVMFEARLIYIYIDIISGIDNLILPQLKLIYQAIGCRDAERLRYICLMKSLQYYTEGRIQLHYSFKSGASAFPVRRPPIFGEICLLSRNLIIFFTAFRWIKRTTRYNRPITSRETRS